MLPYCSIVFDNTINSHFFIRNIINIFSIIKTKEWLKNLNRRRRTKRKEKTLRKIKLREDLRFVVNVVC